MGPSGAGKDSVLRYARDRVQPGDRLAFSHRYITRASDPSEDFVPLGAVEFELRRDAGLFAFDWEAHGNRYGVGAEIHLWRGAGLSVVVSGSREHFKSLSPPPGTVPILVTASIDVRTRRLLDRARESAGEVRTRLQRENFGMSEPAALVVDNSGPLERAGERLLAILRGVS